MSDSSDLARVFAALRPPVRFEGSLTTATFWPEPELRGNPGWLHGGMAATVLDHVTARAASHALGDVPVVTGRLDLRYRQPVPIEGGPFTVEARVVEPRRRYVRVSGRLLAPGGEPLVEASALFVVRP